MSDTKKEKQELEFHPDAWSRFERAVGVVAKSPPQHRKKRDPAEARPRRSSRKKPKKHSKEKIDR
jgi:hypothetical protein